MEAIGREHFGKKGRDVVTGFVGTIAASCSYMTGCDQVQLVGEWDESKGNAPNGWYDVNRIVIVSDDKLELSDDIMPIPEEAARHTGGPPSEGLPPSMD